MELARCHVAPILKWCAEALLCILSCPASAGCGLACVGLLFEFLALLRSVGPQRWAYDELATIAQMRFRFQVGHRRGAVVLLRSMLSLWWLFCPTARGRLPHRATPVCSLPHASERLLALQEEEDAAEYAAGLASNLFFYAPADVLAGQYMFEDWDPALVGLAGEHMDHH